MTLIHVWKNFTPIQISCNIPLILIARQIVKLFSKTQINKYPTILWIAGLLLLIHFTWYLGVWPGPMGPDGFSLISNINNGTPRHTGKEPAWLIYGLATYGATHRVETLIIPSIILHVFIFTRIIFWIYQKGYKKSALACLLFIAAAPHILNYEVSAYPDSLFSLAFIAILFEIRICLKDKKLNFLSGLLIFILFPIAAFFKGNGIFIMAPIFYLAVRLKKSNSLLLIAIASGWALFIHFGGKANNLGHGHDALHPLILFETVNFMQSKPMNLQDNRHMVTDRTKKIIYQYASQENLDALFDRDYWDTLWHQNHDRINFQAMTQKDKKDLHLEFFKYNVWRNIPAFLSSRLNIFLASAFAQGGIVRPDNAKTSLETVETRSKYNAFHLKHVPQVINRIFEKSYDFRFLLWTPLIGVYLIFQCLILSIKQKRKDDTVITLTIFAQLTGIFIFSIASEYRYLLVIFFSPLLLLPLLYERKSNMDDITHSSQYRSS